MSFQPAIKWSGSKRSQAVEIVSHFPKEIETYYEPFCGGCSVLRTLIESDIKVNKFVCSDLNSGLIDLWNEIKIHPHVVSLHYEMLWNQMKNIVDKDGKKRFFSDVRERYNREHNPLDFMFIMRTTTNGMPRYNSNGEFNNSFHVTRDGIIPQTLREIINEWSELLNNYNVVFKCCSFDEVHPSENDFLYLDPPYANTKGMYFGCFDQNKLFVWLKGVKCGFALSYDGISGDVDNTYDVPTELFDEHLYIKSGNSSFKRIIGKSRDSIVYESLYLKTNIGCEKN